MQTTPMAHPPTSSSPPVGGGDGLPRRLGVWSAAAAAVGLTIGSGIFRVPATVAAESGSVGAIALVWVLGGVITLCGACPDLFFDARSVSPGDYCHPTRRLVRRNPRVLPGPCASP